MIRINVWIFALRFANARKFCVLLRESSSCFYGTESTLGPIPSNMYIPVHPEHPCVFSCWLTIGRNLTDLWFTVGTCTSREHYKTKGTISCFLETMVLNTHVTTPLQGIGYWWVEVNSLGYSLSMETVVWKVVPADWDTRWVWKLLSGILAEDGPLDSLTFPG